MQTDAKVIAIIRDLDRRDCEEILAEYGFEIYDSEETPELREAIEANYLDGTISGLDIIANWPAFQ